MGFFARYTIHPRVTSAFDFSTFSRNNWKGGTASLRSRTRVKRNVAFGARFKGLSLYFLYQNGKLIRIKTGLGTSLIRIQTRTPLWRYPPCDYSKFSLSEVKKTQVPLPENALAALMPRTPDVARKIRKSLESDYKSDFWGRPPK